MTQLKDFKGVALYTAGAITVFALQWGFSSLHGTTTDTGALVYSTCMASRNGDRKTERQCGDVQDRYKYEFLCDGIEASSSCWVERNTELSDKL